MFMRLLQRIWPAWRRRESTAALQRQLAHRRPTRCAIAEPPDGRRQTALGFECGMCGGDATGFRSDTIDGRGLIIDLCDACSFESAELEERLRGWGR